MILGVDHVALSCFDMASSVACLERLGFVAKFSEYGLPNPREKHELLGQEEATHDIAWCRGDEGIAIELTRHGSAVSHSGAGYKVLFEGTARGDGAIEDEDAWLAAFGSFCESTQDEGIRSVYWSEFHSSVYWRPAAVRPRIRYIGIPAVDMAVTMGFWAQALGCRWDTIDDSATVVRGGIVSPNPAWTQEFVVCPGEVQGVSHLDRPGFACVAFLSSNLRADLEHVSQCGPMTATSPFTLGVAGRELLIAMVRDPSGNIIELIQFEKGART